MSGLIDIVPGYQFSLSGKGEWVTLPKLNALASPTGRVGENQITARELSTDITQEIGDLRTSLTTEIEERIFADQAIVSWRQTLEAAYGENLSQIQEELTSNATDISTNAAAITSLESSFGDEFSSIQSQLTANATAISTNAAAITSLESSFGDDVSSLQTQLTANANAISTNAAAITSLESSFGDDVSSLQAQLTTNANAISTNAAAITSLESSFGGDVSSIQAQLTTNANAISTNAAAITTVEANYQAADTAISASVTALSNATADKFGNVSSFWGVSLNANGHVTGQIQLSSSQSASEATGTSEFVVEATKFKVASAGGTAVPLLEVNTSTNRVKITGELVAGSVDIGSGLKNFKVADNGDMDLGGGVITYRGFDSDFGGLSGSTYYQTFKGPTANIVIQGTSSGAGEAAIVGKNWLLNTNTNFLLTPHGKFRTYNTAADSINTDGGIKLGIGDDKYSLAADEYSYDGTNFDTYLILSNVVANVVETGILKTTQNGNIFLRYGAAEGVHTDIEMRESGGSMQWRKNGGSWVTFANV